MYRFGDFSVLLWEEPDHGHLDVQTLWARVVEHVRVAIPACPLKVEPVEVAAVLGLLLHVMWRDVIVVFNLE